MKIFLMGFMGCGKTTLGKKLAAFLNFDFCDTDIFFEKKYNISISEFFSQFGETEFRKKEREILFELFDFQRNMIIATGGGLPCFFDNLEIINKNGKTIYLKTSVKNLVLRLYNDSQQRPLTKGKTFAELEIFVKNLLTFREKFYEKANLIIEEEDFCENIEKIKSILVLKE